MRFRTLNDWLSWQETLHPRAIDPGLERVRLVCESLGLSRPAKRIVVVAGTNGKGSCVAYLDTILRTAGYRTGAYTSPHLLRYNERIRVNDEEAGDDALCRAFQRIDEARADVSLSYFEFGTLAALLLFEQSDLDVSVLEVGMGGRLDAVNVVDADVAVITSVSLDHQDWLGPDRDSIGREKAGILRRGRPAVCGDRDPPSSLLGIAEDLDVDLHRLGRDYDWRRANDRWCWRGPRRRIDDLPAPGLAGSMQYDNASTALMALECLFAGAGPDPALLRRALPRVRLAGRQQWVRRDGRDAVLDVAHNPAAVRTLFRDLGRPPRGRQFAVFACMGNKDVEGVVAEAAPWVDYWSVASFEDSRAMPSAELAARVRNTVSAVPVVEYPDVDAALAGVLGETGADDRIVVFGSFHTVAAVMTQDL